MSEWESAGKSDEWYTPKYIFDALGGHFDLDVAAPTQATHVPAREFITQDSLRRPWHGFVWMNPPFGARNGIAPWLDKFAEHGDGIALVPDRTSAPWFQRFAPRCDAALFLSPKVKFERPNATIGKSPGSGTVLFAIGERACVALYDARSLGWYVRLGEDRNG